METSGLGVKIAGCVLEAEYILLLLVLFCKSIRCIHYPPPWSLWQWFAEAIVCVCACVPLPSLCACLIESTTPASRSAVWKSSVLQEYVIWVNRCLTARTLLGIGAVEIMGFGQVFYIFTLAHLWINQGIPQTGWKRKAKVDLAFLPFVLFLPFPAALLAQHSAEVEAQEEVAVISSHSSGLPCGQGAALALVPAALLALAQHTTALPSRRGLFTLYGVILLLLIVGMMAVKHRVIQDGLGKLH